MKRLCWQTMFALILLAGAGLLRAEDAPAKGRRGF